MNQDESTLKLDSENEPLILFPTLETIAEKQSWRLRQSRDGGRKTKHAIPLSSVESLCHNK